jgi:hypothetical protein
MKKIIISLVFLIGLTASGKTKESIQRKFYKTVEIAYARGLSLSTDSPFDLNGWNNAYTKSLRIGAGWFIGPHFSIGLGFGADRYERPGANTFPLYIDLRGFLKNKANTPFAFFDAGKAVAFSAAQEKGKLLDTGLGYQLQISPKSMLNFKIGYSYFKSKEFYRNESKWNYLKRNSLRFSLGFVF